MALLYGDNRYVWSWIHNSYALQFLTMFAWYKDFAYLQVQISVHEHFGSLSFTILYNYAISIIKLIWYRVEN